MTSNDEDDPVTKAFEEVFKDIETRAPIPMDPKNPVAAFDEEHQRRMGDIEKIRQALLEKGRRPK